MTEVEIESLQIQAKELKGLPPPLPQKKKKKIIRSQKDEGRILPNRFQGEHNFADAIDFKLLAIRRKSQYISVCLFVFAF